MKFPTNDFRTADAGRRACAQLVRSVSSTNSAPLRTAAAGCALARLHDLKKTNSYAILAAPQSFKDISATISALVEVYSVSLREVVTPNSTPRPTGAGEERAGMKDSHRTAIDDAECSKQIGGSGCGRAGDGAAAGHCAGPCPEDWVPLLVDSSALVADCLTRGTSARDIFALTPASAVCTTDPEHRVRQIRSCAVSMASALLLSDALPALSRLLSAEAHRGPAQALLSPGQLTTCLQPLAALLKAGAASPNALLYADSPSPQQHGPPRAPFSPTTTATTSTSPAPSPIPPTPAATSSTSTPPAARLSASIPAATTPPQGTERCSKPPAAADHPGGSAAAPPPHGHGATASFPTEKPRRTKRLGPAVLCAVAESGVVEAACSAAVPLVVQQGGGGGLQPKWGCGASHDHEQLLVQLLDLPPLLLTALQGNLADSLSTDRLRSMLTGPCVQYALAAHSVSQLHAVDGGTTYGLPHDCLLLPVREAGATALSCKGVIAAASWWLRLCGVEGFELEPRALSPRGLFELCLRKAEVAADCWRRRNGLPAAAAEVAAAAATRAGASGSGGQGAGGSSSSSKAARSGRQQRQGKAALEVDTVGLCLLGGAGSTASGSSGSPAADPPRATLDPSQCPDLVIQAMACSRALAKSSCGVGARNAAWLGDGGPLARRWWRAAVAAVHCALDEMDAVGPRPAAGSLDKVLDLSLATPGRNPGFALPAAPPPPLSAALDAGCLSYLERTLRTCFRTCSTPAEAVRLCGGLFTEDVEANWHLLLAFGDEKEAAAFLATVTKVARRACEERARPGGDRKACSAVMYWLYRRLSLCMVRAADHIAVRVAVERGFRRPDGSVLEQGGGSGGGGGRNGGGGDTNGGDGGGSGGGSRGYSAGCNGDGGAGSSDGAVCSAAACGAHGTATIAAAASAGSLSPPEQQLMRLLSFALPLWLPLWLDLAAAMLTDGRLTRSWRGQVRWAFEVLDLVQHLCMDALEKKDLRAAESWRSIAGRSGDEVVDMLDACSGMLEREEAAARGIRGAQPQAECGVTAEQLHQMMDEVEQGLFTLDMDLPQAMIRRGEVEGGWEGAWPLVGLGLLSPPCDARQLLPCCSNPRCAELAGDSEAGVALKRCGGACGGAAAYCCAACQRAHWAAGHREVCTGRRRGGERDGGDW